VELDGCVAGLVFFTVFRVSSAERADEARSAQQEAIRLESRINQLETRLYSIESSLRTLEQQSRLGSVSSRNVLPQDLDLLTSTVHALQLRLNEDECALAKLDERTLSPAMRAARQKSSGARTDPCRLSADTSLHLPERR
jgi:hypothetical protein